MKTHRPLAAGLLLTTVLTVCPFWANSEELKAGKPNAEASKTSETDAAETQGEVTETLPAESKPQSDRYSFRTYPAGLLFGHVRGDLLFKTSKSFAIGPMAESINQDFIAIRNHSTGVGVTSLLALGREVFSDGWYLAPELIYRTGRAGTNIIFFDYDAYYRMYTFNLTVGYKWFWKTGFNMMLGAGGGVHSVETYDGEVRFWGGTATAKTQSRDRGTYVGLALDWVMGFSF